MAIPNVNYGSKLSLEMVNCYNKYFEHREKIDLEKKIKNELLNIDNTIVTDTKAKLTDAKPRGYLDCNQDEQLKKSIVYIHKRFYPGIFEDKIKGLPAGWDSINDADIQQPIILPAGSNPFNNVYTHQTITADLRLKQMLSNINLSLVTIDTLTEKDINSIVQSLDELIETDQ